MLASLKAGFEKLILKSRYTPKIMLASIVSLPIKAVGMFDKLSSVLATVLTTGVGILTLKSTRRMILPLSSVKLPNPSLTRLP